MTEILTESFCERCGTRYTFETVHQRGRPLGRLGTIGRGLKNFVVMEDASFDEAMAVARSEDESRTTNAQLEAFHRTFNFCLSCRQYTCAECWNPVEGRCQSCAPLPVAEAPAFVEGAPGVVDRVLGATIPFAIPEPPIAVAPAPAPPPTAKAPLATVAEPPPALAEPAPAAHVEMPAPQGTEAEPAEAAESLVEPVGEPDTIAAAEPVGEPDAVAEAEPEPELMADAALGETSAGRFGATDVPVAEGPAFDADEPAVAIETPAARAPDPEVPAAETSPMIQPAAPAFPGFQPGRSLDAEIAAYELRIAALAEEPVDSEPPLQAVATREPGPGGHITSATSSPSLGQTLLAAAVAAPGAVAGMSPGTCHSCGLSISASARFCRRCGSRQDA